MTILEYSWLTYLYLVVYGLFFTWRKVSMNPKKSDRLITELTSNNFVSENDFRIGIIIVCLIPIINILVVEAHTISSIKKLLK